MRTVLFIGFLGAGCGDSGPPSQYQTCLDACAHQKVCLGWTDADVKACQLNQCDSMKSAYDASDSQLRAQCKNANDILVALHGCYTQDCGQQANDCATAAANSCVSK